VGKLLFDSASYGICLAFNKYNDPGIQYLKVDFGKKSGSYLVKHTSGTIFSFDKTANYYALKITEDSITFDKGCTDIGKKKKKKKKKQKMFLLMKYY